MGGICSLSAPGSHLAQFCNILLHFCDGFSLVSVTRAAFPTRMGTHQPTACVFLIPCLLALNPIVFFFPSPPNSLPRWKYPQDIQSLKAAAWRGGIKGCRGALVVRGSCWAHLQKGGWPQALGGFSCASSNKETLPVVKGRLRGVQREC